MIESPRDVIFRELVQVYSPEDIGKGWWDSDSKVLNDVRNVTTGVLSHLVFVSLQGSDARGDYYRRTVMDEVVRLVWCTFPGGTTAEYAARQIVKALGIEP